MLRRDKVRHTRLILCMGTAVDVDFHQIVDLSTKSSLVYQELFCMVALSASSSNPDDDDRNEEIKKANRFNLFCEQNKGALHFFFLTTFLCCRDQDVNAIIDRESL